VGSSLHLAVLELLQFRLELLKDALIQCTPSEFPRLQGEAQAYEKLIKEFQRAKDNVRT
jgi:hypothetical protein